MGWWLASAWRLHSQPRTLTGQGGCCCARFPLWASQVCFDFLFSFRSPKDETSFFNTSLTLLIYHMVLILRPLPLGVGFKPLPAVPGLSPPFSPCRVHR